MHVQILNPLFSIFSSPLSANSISLGASCSKMTVEEHDIERDDIREVDEARGEARGREIYDDERESRARGLCSIYSNDDNMMRRDAESVCFVFDLFER